MTQILQNGASSTYYNLLQIQSGPYGIIGDYACEVSNSIGTSTRNISIEGTGIECFVKVTHLILCTVSPLCFSGV